MIFSEIIHFYGDYNLHLYPFMVIIYDYLVGGIPTPVVNSG